MNIKPLADRVVVRPIDQEQISPGGIIIPDTAKEKPTEGEVMEVGPGRIEKGQRIPLDVKKGDRILYGRYSGTEVTVAGKEYLILKETDIFAIIQRG